jgi:hypothetical protein|tara:strand:- start:1959 stop:2174 length:216 start_codon:yes stop_codon:yes gene_type:complete
MIDTDKYEGLTIDDWYKMNHHDWKDVVNEHNDLLAEVKRLREAIADVANSMEAADPSLLRSFIKDLLEVIE